MQRQFVYQESVLEVEWTHPEEHVAGYLICAIGVDSGCVQENSLSK